MHDRASGSGRVRDACVRVGARLSAWKVMDGTTGGGGRWVYLKERTE